MPNIIIDTWPVPPKRLHCIYFPSQLSDARFHRVVFRSPSSSRDCDSCSRPCQRRLWLKHIEAETKWPPFRRRHLKCIFLNENVWIPIEISLKFVPKVPINNISALVQIMAWRRPGDKPLSEPMAICLLTHICVTRPQWVNRLSRWRSARLQ